MISMIIQGYFRTNLWMECNLVVIRTWSRSYCLPQLWIEFHSPLLVTSWFFVVWYDTLHCANSTNPPKLNPPMKLTFWVSDQQQPLNPGQMFIIFLFSMSPQLGRWSHYINQIISHNINQIISYIYINIYIPSNWWYTYPPEKYEFVRLDHHPNYGGFNKIHVPNHQPAIIS